jgi:hypothetical protein
MGPWGARPPAPPAAVGGWGASTIASVPFDPTTGVMDVLLAIAALAAAVTLVRSWRRFWDADFTAADRRLATQVGVFLVPPVVVLFHELGHLFAARALGVRVVGFRYGLFEGSVTVAGRLSRYENWLIALAGNVVSLVAGFLLLAVGIGGRRLRAPARYLLAVSGLIEIVFTLVGYPLFSLTSNFGDWIAIYDVRRLPELAWATAAVHAALLVALHRWWRRRGRSTLFTISSGAGGRVAQLEAAIASSPHDPAPRLALADLYASHGELALARTTLDDAVTACGDVPRLHLARARISMYQRRWNDAVVAARRGLQAGGEEDVRQPLWANLALALTQMERPDHALPAYDHLTPPLADDARVRYGRGVVRLEQGDVEGGRSDLQAVVDNLPEHHLLRLWAEARLEGRDVEVPSDPDAPAYARAGPPPPAPIAGL